MKKSFFTPDNSLFSCGEMQLAYIVKCAKGRVIQNSQDSAAALRSYFEPSMNWRECFYCLFLNRAGHIITVFRASEGGQSGTIADPKIIFQAALKANASSIILAHNHPSGNTEPSNADRDITRKLVQGGQLLDIGILDHLIITEKEYYSFADNDLI